MNSTKETQENDKIESDDDFQYEEVSLEDDWSVTEGEEDLEAMVKAIQNRAQACAAPPDTALTRRPEAADDFLRSFLTHMGMTETLDCFQTEWAEMEQKGVLDPELVSVVPEVYIENRHLERELQRAQREAQEYSRAASSAAETLVRVQRARDFHRLQHKRVVQEKNRLIEDMRKLKVQCSSYEPQVKKMSEKYQEVLRQTMLVTLERDKALGQAAQQSDPSCGDPGEGGRGMDRTPSMIQPRPPSYANVSRSQTRVQCRKAK